MQGQTACGIGFASITGISGHGVAQLGKMDPDLVFTAGFKPHFQQRMMGGAPENAVMGDGKPAFLCVPAAVNFQKLIFA